MAHSETPWREKDVLTPPEVAKILRRSMPTVYKALREREITSFRIGGRLLVPTSAIAALLDQHDS